MTFFLSASSRAAIPFCNLEKRHDGCRIWAVLAVPAAVETPAHAVRETATKTRMHKAGASEPRMEEARVTKAAICALVSRGQSADVSPPRLRRCQGKRERSLKRENGTAPGAPHCEAPTSLRSPASRDRKFVRLSAGGKWIRTSGSAPDRQRVQCTCEMGPDRPSAGQFHPSSCPVGKPSRCLAASRPVTAYRRISMPPGPRRR